MREEFIDKIGPSNITIAFERMGSPTSIPVLLIMGAGAQMIAWPDGFCKCLIDQGLFLIRFDSRDTGRSTHFNDAPVPDFKSVMAGDYSTVGYTLSDMAADSIGLTNALGFEKIHLVGASMGGMIAQTMAIEYPSRVKSLTSIMSTTGDQSVGQADFGALSKHGEPPYNDRQAYIQWRLKMLKTLGSPGYSFDEEAAAVTARLSWDRDHDRMGMVRQSVAVLKSGDRTKDLQQLSLPTLVIHGKADKMIDVSGGIATAEAIPNARIFLFDGMGHGIPQPLWGEIANLIAGNIQLAEEGWGNG